MSKFTIAALAVLVVLPGIASASLQVGYDVTNTALTYDKSTKVLEVNDTAFTGVAPGSDVLIDVEQNGVSLGQAKIWDFAPGGSDVKFVATRTGGTDAAPEFDGSLKIWDWNGALKIDALFDSTSVAIAGGALEIRGNLTGNPAANPILVPGTNPWTFKGSTFVAGSISVNSSVTLPSEVTNALNGVLLSIQFEVDDDDTVASLFGGDSGVTELAGGELKGEIVPAPAAVALAGMGLGLVGLVKRRFRK